MDTSPIVVETILNAPASRIWESISNKEVMKQWYFDIENFKPEVGAEFQFYGGDKETQYLHLCKIKEVIPGKKLSHTWAYENVPVETLVTFELTAEGNNQTKIKLTHEGLEKFPADNKAFAKENFVAGWNHIIKTSLKAFAEKN